MTNFGVTNNRQEQREAVSAEVMLLTARCEEVFNSLVELRRLDPPAARAQVGTMALELDRQNAAPAELSPDAPTSAADELEKLRREIAAMHDAKASPEDTYNEIAA
jgi:hypothetical protein